MFYSQFILAKKGPLGTIWIAAHLERKLRKNQVADTDIGVSVDSILFPDVPIALRLSSHLLLGVVRIYSRKVNYLFDDCSDTLLKIKQAFRSTAVDLPPEESTAPYHSITLPETFDLDDFELPDNDVFQGNYVDHHISSKEQITLQDTMDGVVYSSSQFGLDERFGDGDTSHIGLDLVEDLFLDKLGDRGDDGVMLNSDADPQTSFQPITRFEEGDENREDTNEISQALTAAGRGNQDYAVAPSTPCLVEEPNFCNDHLEIDNHNSVELEPIENVGTDVVKSHHHEDNLNLQMTPDAVPLEENGYDHCGESIQHLKPKGDLRTASENVKHLQNGGLSNNEANVESSPSSSQEASKEDNCQKPCSAVENMAVKFSSSNTVLTEPEGIPAGDQGLQIDVVNNIEVSQNVEESCTPSNPLMKPAGTEANVEDQACYKPNDCKIRDPEEDMASTQVHILQRCKSDLNQSPNISLGGDASVAQPDITNAVDKPCSLETSEMDDAVIASGTSAEMPGELCHPITSVKPSIEGKWTPEPNPSEDVETDRRNIDAVSKDTLDFFNSSAVSELPAPEKLRSMPEVRGNLLNNFLFETTPDKTVSIESEGDGTESRRNQGKKRSFTESTLAYQSLNADESFAKTQLKQTGEFIPGDDDLLSSILVGRKSSILKLKATPTPTELAPKKRPRITSRASASASKRKVLMDDSMVLHGDTIRQQLTSTEDIRRVRKKAPATRHEVWIIQKQFLEDEVFTEPISTGMSIELIGLHSETYDLSSIIISIDKSISALGSAKDTEPTAQPNVMKGNETEGSTDTCLIRIDGEAQHAGILVHDENQQGANTSLGSPENEAQLQIDDISAGIVVKTSNHEHGEITEMEVDGASAEVADEAGCNVSHGVEYTCSTGLVSDVPLSDDKDDSVLDLCNGQGISRGHSGENPSDNILEIETGHGTRGEHLLKGTEDYEDLEERGEIFTSSSWPAGNAEPSITTTPLETGMCQDFIVVSNQSMEEIASDVPEFVKEYEDVTTELEFDDKNKAGDVCCEEPKGSSSYLAESDVKNNSLNCGVTSLFMDMERPAFLEAEVPAGVMYLETSGLNHSLVEDHEELGTIMGEHDTEFLNVDDDDVDEDEDYNPSAEETRLLENSGWSSRSRAVAKYLQTLFDKETEVGKKIIPMDNLLSGKTRKEASRMFFETLVLKTRDYIHVEQPTPFNNIHIKPRGKLLKTDF